VPGHSREVSLADCARACTQQGCDAFGYDRVYPNYCYFYRKPYVTKNRPGMTLGERTEFGAALPAQTEGATSLEPGIKLAQASGETAPVPTASDIVHCPNGPVKVTGFKLTCDWILSGGTTLGSKIDDKAYNAGLRNIPDKRDFAIVFTLPASGIVRICL
jgi:hypothetical protein